MRMLRGCGWVGAVVILGTSVSAARAADGSLCCHRCKREACCSPATTTYYMQPTCGYEPVTVCASPCDCQPHRGPIRRFLHRLFHKHECCAPAAVPAAAEFPAPAGPACVPAAPAPSGVYVPPPAAVAPPPGSPLAPPPGATFAPPASSIPPAVGSSYRVPAPQTVHFEHLASYHRPQN